MGGAEYIKPLKLNVKNIGTSLSSVISPLTEVSFGDANWVPNFTLPSTANDRDRVVIKSSATWSAKISNTHVNTAVTLTLKKGDKYEFMYVSDRAYRVLMSSPIKTIDANTTIPSILPSMSEPTLKVKIE